MDFASEDTLQSKSRMKTGIRKIMKHSYSVSLKDCTIPGINIGGLSGFGKMAHGDSLEFSCSNSCQVLNPTTKIEGAYLMPIKWVTKLVWMQMVIIC